MEKDIEAKIKNFFSDYSTKIYKKGETIIKPEEPLVYIYNINSGYVKSYSLNDDGLELTINIYKPFSFFPITETLAGKINTYFFTAITDVEVTRAPTHKVHKFVKDNPDIMYDLIKRISSGLEGFMIRTQYLIRSNSGQKVASSFVLLARRFGKSVGNNKMKILLPQTHEDISNLSGVSRETTSLEIKKFKDEKIITVKRKHYTIEDFEKMKDLSTIYYEDEPLPFRY